MSVKFLLGLVAATLLLSSCTALKNVQVTQPASPFPYNSRGP